MHSLNLLSNQVQNQAKSIQYKILHAVVYIYVWVS